MSADIERGTGTGLSRRQVLTRGAVAAGVVWAAPIIRTTAAYATGGTEIPCLNFYFVVIKPNGRCRPPVIRKGLPGYTTDNARAYADKETGEDIMHGPDRLPPAIEQWLIDNPKITLQFPTVCPQLTQSSSEAWALLLPEVIGPNAIARQCRMAIGWGRKSNNYKDNSFAEAYVDPHPPLAIQVGRRLIFPCPRPLPEHDNTNSLRSDGAPTSGIDPVQSDGAPSTGVDPVESDGAPSAGIGSSSNETDIGAFDDGTGLGASGLSGDSSIGGDGDVTDGSDIGGDGDVTDGSRISGDGTPSADQTMGPGQCISAAYVIYCCPR